MTVGSKLGPYEILSRVGAGGMGEVFKARDSRLDRIVAIKISAERFTDRFDREARAVAALNHPHIGTLYDVGPDYLVMEFVEGKPLAGPLPVDEALRYAIQIADALDAAHRKGIVHRDLKPDNVLVTKSGVKLLDFGLAQMAAPSLSEDSATRALTSEGTISGTLQYMAPEQLRGEPADARSDIFAFGAVLHEMLTGRRAFAAKDAASTIAAILKEQPPELKAAVALRRVVDLCLAKDPDDRWQSARDLKRELEWLAEGGIAERKMPVAPAGRHLRNRILAVAMAVVCLALLGVAVLHWREVPPAAMVTRFIVPPPDPTAIITRLSLSPDGRHLAFIARGRLWLRSFDTLESRPLGGTEGAGSPFWSPDGRYIAFASGGKLKKIPVEGGPAITICSISTNLPGTWGPDGTILIGQVGDGVYRVAAVGGTPARVTKVDSARGETRHLLPQFLPGGKQFLFIAASGSAENSTLCAASLMSPVCKPIMRAESFSAYAPSAPESTDGFLVFGRQNTLMAQPFDARNLRVTGDAFPIAESVASAASTLGTPLPAYFFAVSDRGATLAYSSDTGTEAQLTWLDRAGHTVGEVGAAASILRVALMPDANRAIASIRDAGSGSTDLWLLDGKRGTSTKLTFDGRGNNYPVTSPDGEWVAFSSSRGSFQDLFRLRTDGSRESELLLDSPAPKQPTSWTTDGRFLLYDLLAESGKYEVWALPDPWGPIGPRQPVRVVQTTGNAQTGRVSPDEKWVSYESDETGRKEVYVRPFGPGRETGARWPVSTGGGLAARWRDDGKELFFVTGTGGKAMAVEVTAEGERFQTGVPRALFDLGLSVPIGWGISSDGQRFLMGFPSKQQAAPPVIVVQNWISGLKK